MWVTTTDGQSINLRQVAYLRIWPPGQTKAGAHSVVAHGLSTKLGHLAIATGLSKEEADRLVDLLSQRADLDGAVDAGYLLDNQPALH